MEKFYTSTIRTASYTESTPIPQNMRAGTTKKTYKANK